MNFSTRPRILAIVSLLLLAGCASTGEAGRFVGNVIGSGVRSAMIGDEPSVVVIQEHRGWGRGRGWGGPRWCSDWRYGVQYRC